MRYLVGLGDGHGNDTMGKRTPLFPNGTLMKENEFTSVVVNYINELLKPYDNVDVFFIASEKRDTSLDERVARVNEVYTRNKEIYDKMVLVDVHANAMKDIWNDIANGTATFYYPGNEVDKVFAQVIQKNLIAKTGLKPHRGGVVEGDFQIIREAKVTACLCECAFMDNLEEAKLLMTDEFRRACAIGIVNGLLEYFGINQPTKEVEETTMAKVKYSVTTKGTHQLEGNPENLTSVIVDKKIWDITDYTNCINGTFFWWDNTGKTYSTSPLIIEGQIIQRFCNHELPQSVFVIYKDGSVSMQKVKDVYLLKNLADIRMAIGGIGLRNTLDSTFKYNPAGEGFKSPYDDVLRQTNKTVIGYNKKLHKVYLMTRPNIIHKQPWYKANQYDLLKLVKDCDYDIALSLDGGGSTFMDANNEYVMQGENDRRINNIIRFRL